MTELFELDNGIPVLYEYMRDARSTAFGVFIKTGSALENKENNGISHVIEHMVFKGTVKHNAKQLADIMSDLGGDVNAYTAKELTSYYGRVLNSDFETATEIIAEMLTTPKFDEKELSKEKRVIIDEIALYDDSPEDMCHELLQKKIWKNSPYGYIISGTRKNVKSFMTEDVFREWENSYIADNYIISVSGGVKSQEAISALNRHFGNIKRTGKENIYPVPKYEKCFLSKYKDTEQLHMNIAFENVSAADEDRFPVSIFNAALGGNLNARLFQYVREEMGLTYNIYSYSSMFNTAGLLHIYASMNPVQVQKVTKSVMHVIREFVKKGMEQKEIETIKKQIATELILSGESAAARMNSNARSYMSLGRIEEIDETIEKVKNVSVEEVNECIRKYLKTTECSMSIIGNTEPVNIQEIKKEINNEQF